MVGNTSSLLKSRAFISLREVQYIDECIFRLLTRHSFRYCSNLDRVTTSGRPARKVREIVQNVGNFDMLVEPDSLFLDKFSPDYNIPKCFPQFPSFVRMKFSIENVMKGWCTAMYGLNGNGWKEVRNRWIHVYFESRQRGSLGSTKTARKWDLANTLPKQ